MRRRWVMWWTIPICGMAALTGCGNDVGPEPEAAEASASRDADSGPESDANEAAVTAMETAKKSVDDSTVLALRRDNSCDHGRFCWSVDVAVDAEEQHALLVTADGKKVVEEKSADKVDKDVKAALAAKRAAAQVTEDATREQPGVVATVEIDELGDGTAIWDVTLDDNGSQTKYTYDTQSGDPIASGAVDD